MLSLNALKLPIALFALTGCSNYGQVPQDWGAELDQAEQAYEGRLRESSVFLMPVDKIFVDPEIQGLARAAGRGAVSDIRQASANGVNINATGHNNATPLFWAWRNRSIRGFEELLRQGADPNLKIEAGTTNTSVLHEAAGDPDVRYIELALKYGGNPNLYAGAPSKTPLFMTFSLPLRESQQIIRTLLNAGADINATTGREVVAETSFGGRPAVFVAAQVHRYDIVLYLLTLGSDYTIKDEYERDLISQLTRDFQLFNDGSNEGRSIRQVIQWLQGDGAAIEIE